MYSILRYKFLHFVNYGNNYYLRQLVWNIYSARSQIYFGSHVFLAATLISKSSRVSQLAHKTI